MSKRKVGQTPRDFLRSMLARWKETRRQDLEWTTRAEERLRALEDLRRMRRCAQFVPYL
jgi:hypothetical protein